jgi:preprotein translocase subunit SecG
LGTNTKIMFTCWIIIGLLIYFSYGKRHSHMGQIEKPAETNE